MENWNEMDEVARETVEVKKTENGTWESIKNKASGAFEKVKEFADDHEIELIAMGLGVAGGMLCNIYGQIIGYDRGLAAGSKISDKASEAWFELGKYSGRAETLEELVSKDGIQKKTW